MTNLALKELSPMFKEMYSSVGRPSIAPEKLLRALLSQTLYSIRSELMLVEQLDLSRDRLLVVDPTIIPLIFFSHSLRIASPRLFALQSICLSMLIANQIWRIL